MKTTCLTTPLRRAGPGPGRMAAILTLILISLAGEVRAAMDIYMKLEGIPGEIADGPFTGWIPLTGIGATAEIPPSATVPPAPVMPVYGFSVVKPLSPSSPPLFLNLASGRRIARAGLVLMEGPLQVLRITLSDVMVSSCAIVGDGGMPQETCSFNYQKIEWSVRGRDGDGSGETTTINPAANTAVLRLRPPFRASLGQSPDQRGLRITCPVEAGHRYRLRGNATLTGPWETIVEFQATEDGTFDREIPISTNKLFLRLEEVD